MIAILDYGVGNLFSLSSSLSSLGVENKITRCAEDIKAAAQIILPGVGAFGDAVQKLTATGLVPILKAEVSGGKPLLGICLGMQLLFEKSYEYGEHNGLGFIGGSVCPLEADLRAAGYDYKVPHMGWNALRLPENGRQNPLVANIKEGDFVYFVHSFYAKNCESALVASAEYGVCVPALVASGKVYGCQFHPEKSGEVGLRILRAFASL